MELPEESLITVGHGFREGGAGFPALFPEVACFDQPRSRRRLPIPEPRVKMSWPSWRSATGRPDSDPFRLPGIGCRKMKLDPRPELPDSGPDFQNLPLDRVELSSRPRRSLKMTPPQSMHQHIGYRMEEEPELVGFEAMAGGPVRTEMGFVVLDQKFHPSSVAVDHFVNDAPRPALEVRHHKSEVRAHGVVFGLNDDSTIFGPASRPVAKLAKETNRLPLSPETSLGLFNQAGRPLPQHRIRHKSQGILQVLRLAKPDDFGRGVMRIGAKQNPHPGPGLPDFSDHSLKDGHNLRTRRPLPRPQHRRHQLPAFPLVEMDRQITVFIKEGVEESQLLMTMGRVFGIVDVQNDRHGRRPIRFDKRFDQDLGDAVKIRPRDGVLQPRERRLAGQWLIFREPFAGHLQGRVLPERVRIVGVFVTTRNLEDPLLEHVQERMPRIAGMTTIMKKLGDAVEELHPAFDLPEEKHSSVGRNLAAVKIDFDLFSPDIFKKKSFGGMMYFVQSCSSFNCPKRIVNQYVMKGNSFFYE